MDGQVEETVPPADIPNSSSDDKPEAVEQNSSSDDKPEVVEHNSSSDDKPEAAEQVNNDKLEEPKEYKKSEIFLRGEQVPYLCEILRGNDVEPPASNFVSFADPICDEYLKFVAKTGRPLFDWSILKPFFLWKVECVMVDIDRGAPFDHRSVVSNTDRSTSRQYMERILSASGSLPGVPFTIQRICELLIQPQKHYKRADKFYRALEKNVSVVTTVDREGRRETERQPDEIDDGHDVASVEDRRNSITNEQAA